MEEEKRTRYAGGTKRFGKNMTEGRSWDEDKEGGARKAEERKQARLEGEGRKAEGETTEVYGRWSERAHGLGRCCGVIQSRFRPMNFLRREEGEPAGRGPRPVVGSGGGQWGGRAAQRAATRLAGPVTPVRPGPQPLVSDLQHWKYDELSQGGSVRAHRCAVCPLLHTR